ncbi:Vacuolar protein sorting-associated protein ist1 [Fusarium torreyae]|uniref:Vacuolar protein sorting-associated protein ist1 n=1 Tax=Fusarium torreyae TaxID=1237075 RepID=A0A9W8SDQ9_9HYPO|nr:Vacuolar protein sorting-associated protein ist1 [Fusarium torreyae]
MAPGASLVTKLKVQLKLTIARLRMVQQRDEQLGKTARRAMAQLLEAGKVDSARIRVENIIRSDITSELHEMLELYCELLLARAGLMEGHTVDPGLEEAIQSLIYAAPKTEIKELGTVRNLLAEKYGKEYVLAATENADGKVNEKVVKKLSVTPPREELVVGYLEEIARAYGVDWPKREAVSPPPELLDAEDDDDEEPSGGQKQKVLETPLAADTKDPALNTPVKKLAGGGPTSPLTVTPPRMTTDNIHPKVTLGSVELKPSKKAEPASRKNEPDGSIPDLGDLERRFAALKKR